jgi:hypothetical protein
MKIINCIILFVLIVLFMGCKVELHPLDTLEKLAKTRNK